MGVPEPAGRRPIPSRGSAWAIRAARWLQRQGVRPNQISTLSVLIAVAAAACLILAGRTEGMARAALLVAAAALIPLRLLCNLLDGMLAVEGGLRTPTGELYNELPDRLADVAIITGAGYATSVPWGPELGWAAAATALLTAYTRTLGVAAGAAQHFAGPMAKPRRMHVLIAACLIAAVTAVSGGRDGWAIAAALLLILAGGIVTVIARLRHIAADLEDA